MARGKGWTQEQWEQHGAEAIVDLVYDRLVVPWGEVEGRISSQGWKDYRRVQPIQLSGALKRLRAERPPRVEEDWSQHATPIHTLRVPISEGTKREIERLRGRKRKLYLRYIHWTQDERLCGKPAEHVVLESMRSASGDAGLYVPPQTPGRVDEIDGISPGDKGPLDLWAWILDLESISAELPMVVEVKNVRRWLYASPPELWELLVKAAAVAVSRPVLPVLACCWSGPLAWWMAYDIGFFTAQMRTQVFSPSVPEREFDEVATEFGLPMTRHTGPLDSIVSWLGTDLRKPPPSPPPEDTAWYRRQAERFQALAPIILDHSALAHSMDDAQKQRVFASFRARVQEVATWPLRGGW